MLHKLPDVRQRAELLEQAQSLKARIEAKAPGAEVSKLAAGLRWRVIDAYKIAVAPKSAPDSKRGATLYAAHCAACHGAQGRGDGPAAEGLDPAPSNFHERERMARRSVYGLYSTIALGVAGTSMNTFGNLSEEDRWALAFYVGTLGLDARETQKGAALWQAGRGKSEIGTLRSLATLTDNEIAQAHGPEVAAVFAWLKANPQASPVDVIALGALGFYPTTQTMLAQAAMLLVVVAAFAWMRVSSQRKAGGA